MTLEQNIVNEAASTGSVKNQRKIVASKRHTSDNFVIENVDRDIKEVAKRKKYQNSREQSGSELSGKSSTHISPLKIKPGERRLIE